MNARTIVATMATSVTNTAGVPVGEWNHVSLAATTFSAKFLGANVAVTVQVSQDDSTYFPLQQMLNSGTTFSAVAVAVPSSAGNYVVDLPNAQYYNYVRFHVDTATSNTYEFKVCVAL